MDLDALEQELHAVGVLGEHVPQLAASMRAAAGPGRSRVEELTAALEAQVGRLLERGTVFRPSDFEIGDGRGAVPLLALLRVRSTVERYLADRGVPEDVRAATLAEIGRQTTRTQRVRGQVGFQDAAWVEIVYRGGFVNVGRLQFELMHDEARGGYVLNTHIPAGGPLPADAVARSLAAGRDVMETAFPEYGPIDEAVCRSWLLDPQLQDLVPGSNVARFAALWELESSEPGDDDTLFFVFDLPRGSGERLAEILPGLTASSRLQRAVLDLWRSGGGMRIHRGHLALDR